MKRNTLRHAAALALCTATLAFAGAAPAGQGNAVIESKQDGAVVLNGASYRTSDGTVIEDREGNRISFAELPSLERGASADDAAVWFEASDDATAPLLHRLKLTGAQPQ
jgi:hypothetical protein